MIDRSRPASVRRVQRCRSAGAAAPTIDFAEVHHELRFETGPAEQAQCEWGQVTVPLGGVRTRLHVFVMTLGYSRRGFAMGFEHERMPDLLAAHEAAFAYFGGRCEQLLYDRMRTVVLSGGKNAPGKVRLNSTFASFAAHWGVTVRLCLPYRAQTKGKVESGVKYVKRNFVPGRSFRDLEDFNTQSMRVACCRHQCVSRSEEPTVPTVPLFTPPKRPGMRETLVRLGMKQWAGLGEIRNLPYTACTSCSSFPVMESFRASLVQLQTVRNSGTRSLHDPARPAPLNRSDLNSDVTACRQIHDIVRHCIRAKDACDDDIPLEESPLSDNTPKPQKRHARLAGVTRIRIRPRFPEVTPLWRSNYVPADPN